MSRMMCALKYGCFTDYFLDEETVINILEHVGGTSADDDRLRLTLPFAALREFLALGDDEAVARARSWDLMLADPDTDPGPDMERDTVQNFLAWFHNMQAMERSGELGAFAERPSGYIDFDFS